MLSCALNNRSCTLNNHCSTSIEVNKHWTIFCTEQLNLRTILSQTAEETFSSHLRLPCYSQKHTCLHTCGDTYIYTCTDTYIHRYIDRYMHSFIDLFIHPVVCHLLCTFSYSVRLWCLRTWTNTVAYKGHLYPVWDVSFWQVSYSNHWIRLSYTAITD